MRITPAADVAGLPYVAPGFCDLQINGYQGVEFNDPKLTVEQVRQAALSQDQFGVTRYLATCTTDSFEVFTHSFETIAKAIDDIVITFVGEPVPIGVFEQDDSVAAARVLVLGLIC